MEFKNIAFGNTVIIFSLIFFELVIKSHTFSSLYELRNGNQDQIKSTANSSPSDDNYNCSGFMGPRPFIWPLNESKAYYAYNPKAAYDPRESSISNTTKTTELNIILFRQFNCSYYKPIHWVFNLDPRSQFTLNTEIDFSERIVLLPSLWNKYDGERYLYTANFRLLYLLPDLRNEFLFSCEPVDPRDPCERSFLQVFNKNLQSLPTDTPIESLKSHSKDLFASSTNQSSFLEEEPFEGNCVSTLVIKVEEGNLIGYKWEGKVDKKSHYRTNETSYFENIFRLTRAQNGPKCVKQLTENEKCDGCKFVGQITNYTLNGVIFRGTNNGRHQIYKGHFSVPSGGREERKFYFNWQISSEIIRDEMMQIKIPKRIFANVPFEVTCRVSVFHFAYGSIITDKSIPDHEDVRPREYFSPLGYREVKQKLMFKLVNEPKTVSCFAPLKKSEDWIVKFEEIIVEEAIPVSIDWDRNATEFHILSPGFIGAIAECNNVTGNPVPTLSWLFPAKLSEAQKAKLEIITDKDFGFTRIIFPQWEEAYYGTYSCQAKNTFGLTTKSITFQSERGERTSRVAIIVSSSLGGCAVLLAFTIGILAWRIKKQRQDFEIQTQKAIDEFRNGIKSEQKISENDIMDPNFSVMQLPYNEGFEVTYDKWNIEEKLLGAGQFGIVKEGQVQHKGEWVKVAVKQLKSSVEIDEFKSFLFELKIMAYLGHHKNIVSLIAACTEGINERNIFIGVEYCDNGCLLDYLRKFRGTFQNMVTNDGKLSDTSLLNNSSQYANLSTITTYELYRWAYHVACGMEYLGIKKVLHGDLAARNVLLSARKVAKVGDFGLSRVLMNSENYTKRSKTALPWKWMAIESLKERIFSVNSDIWSYGIFLYEVFTVGQAPYPGIGWSPDFVRQLEGGLRMERPVFCTESVYKVMRSCWEQDPHSRPSYVKIKRKLSKGLQRLSTILKNVEAHHHLPASSSTSSSPPKRSTFLASLASRRTSSVNNETTAILAMDNIVTYTNVQRGTNYYKNC